MKNGRKTDVIIEPCTRNVGGVEIQRERHYTVYADSGLLETICKVEGVLYAWGSPAGDTPPYSVEIDPRYDADFVLEEIKAAILCRAERGE